MRTIFTIISGLLVTATLAPMVIVAGLLGVKEGPNSFYERVMRRWAGALCSAAGVRIHVHNPERMARDHGAVYVSNHVSWFDVFTLAAVLPRYTWVAKAELRRIPVFGWAAETAGIVFMDRENRKAAFDKYRGAVVQVERGRSIIVCPEGTRGESYRLRPFKKGPFVLAIAAHAPVIPVIVYGAREVMPKGSFRIRSGDVHIHLLQEIPTAGLGYEQRAELMEGVFARMGALLEGEYGVENGDLKIAGGEQEAGESALQ